jgi:hypothetical protein
VTTSTGTSNPSTFSIFPSIPSISPGQLISAALETSDGRNPFIPSLYADMYKLTLASTTQVFIDMRSTAFSTLLYLLSESGSILSFGTNAVASSQIVMMLSPGTYYIDVSTNSGGLGAYTISVNVLPYLNNVAPPFAAAGASIPVTLSGERFGAPMTVGVGSGITYSNVNVANPTSAAAMLHLPTDVIAGYTTITVTTSAGTSNSRNFAIFPSIDPITPGQTILGSLLTSDGRNPNFLSAYADIYSMTLNSPTTITINLSSTAFTTRVYLLSAEGTILASNTGAPNSQISTALDAGTYYIVASSSSGGMTGAYTLSLTSTSSERRVRGQITSQ